MLSNTVTVPGLKSHLTEIKFSSQSELMKNFQAASPISSDHQVTAVQDDKGHPMIFSLGTDGEFHLIAHDYAPESPTGWKQINLNDSLKGLGKPVSISARQMPDNSLTLAVVVADEKVKSQHHVYLASRLSNKLSNSKINQTWQKLENYSLWKKWTNPQALPITSVFISPVLDEEEGIAKSDPFVAVSLGVIDTAQTDNYILQSVLDADGRVEAWQEKPFPFPTDLDQSKKLHDFAMGSIDDLGTGLYMLYTSLDGQIQLKFKTLPNEYGRDYVRSFTLPAGVSSIQTASGNGKTTALFVAGKNGVHLFQSDNQGKNAVPVQIAGKEHIADVAPNGLMITEGTPGDWTSVWALSGENLMYFHNGNPGNSWTTPVVFKQGISQFAPIRNQAAQTNELVFIETDSEKTSRILWMSQDALSTSWRTDMIPVYAEAKTIEFNTYTSHINIQDAGGRPILNETFQLSSSERCKVIVNGQTHILTEQNPVVVKSDLMGNLTIINQTTDLSSATFTLGAATLFFGTVEINPAHKVYATLEKVKKDEKTGALNIPDHIRGKLSPESTEALAQGITQMTDLNLGSGKSISYQGNLGRAPQKAAVKLADQRWGMSFENGEVRFDPQEALGDSRMMHGPVTRRATWGQDVFSSMDAWVGDVWQHIKTMINDIKSFVIDVVDGVVNFIVEIGEEILRFVIKVANDVYRVLSLIFEKLKLAFEELIKWLGFLFNWEDILTTSRVMSNLAEKSLDFANYKIEGLEQVITDFFEKQKETITNFIIPDDFKNKQLIGGAQSASDTHAGDDPQVNEVGDFTQSPGGNFAAYQVIHGGMLSGKGEEHAKKSPLESIFSDLLKPTFLSIRDSIEKLGHDLSVFFESGDIKVDKLLALIAGDFLVGILDVLEKIAVGILEVVKSVITLVKDLMTEEINIPFLTAFFNNITKGQKFSVLNGICLLLAVPTTVIYKILAKEAPFAQGTYGLDTAGFREIFAFFGSPLDPEPNTGKRMASRLQIAPERMVFAYDFISGVVYGLSSLISGVLSIAGSYFDEPGKEITAGFLGRLKVAFELLKVGYSIPLLRTNKEAQAFEYADWGVQCLSLFRKTMEAFLTKNPILDAVLGVWLVVEGVVSAVLQIIAEGFYLGDESEKDVMYVHIIKIFESILYGGGDILGGSSQAIPPADPATVITKETLKYAGLGLTIVGVFITVSRVSVVFLNKLQDFELEAG
ncbi:MAG: hypothetical protein KDC34_01600 [Saprospiraceae bacterium]|nr:hypothetical protein [Saprospiraceae bacterium]